MRVVVQKQGQGGLLAIYSGTPLMRPPLGYKNPGRNNEVVALTGLQNNKMT